MSDLIPIWAPWSGRVVTVLLFLVGASLFVWLLARPRLRVPTCRRCRYDLSGTAADSLCPECGHFTAPDGRLTPQRRPLAALACLALGSALPVYVAQGRMRTYGADYYLRLEPLYSCFPTRTIETVRIGGAVLRLTEGRRDTGDGPVTATIRDAGKSLKISEHRVFPADPSAQPRLRDPNDNGVPDVVISTSSGGAHCCYDLVVVELAADGPRTLLELAMKDCHAEFVQRDADAALEIELCDATFAYWNTCFACSPMPDVVLDWDGNTWSLGTSLMYQAPPDADALAEKAKNIAAALFNPNAPEAGPMLWNSPDLWGVMLDLIYTGHAGLAFDFLDQAWPSDRPGKADFRREFLEQLATSPFYDGLRLLNPEADLSSSGLGSDPVR